MSDGNTLLTEIQTLIAAEITGIELRLEPGTFDDFSTKPFGRGYLIDADVERLDYRQERREFTAYFELAIDASGTTRETMQAHLDAIRDAVYADRGSTLGDALNSNFDRATMTAGVVLSLERERLIVGTMQVLAEVIV